MSSFFGKKDTKEPLTAAAAEEGKAGNSAETKPGESSLNTVKGWLTDELNVAIAIGLFSICSASMLLLNKCVADAFHLDASVVIAQMSFAFIVLPVLPAAFLGKLHFGHWKDVALWSCTVPLLFSFMMVTSISALRNSSVGASNVVRNLSPLLMLPVETLLQEKVEYDVHTLVSLFVILGGVVIYVREDVRTSPLGVVLLVVNMILAMTDRLVQRRFIAVTPLDISKTGMVWLNNTIGILPQIGMLFVFNEPAQWSERLNAVQIPQWIAFGFSCALGIGIGWTAVNAQKYVSATTFMVVGNVNKVFVWIFGMVFLGEVHTLLSVFGALISIGGGFYYGYARIMLDAANKKAKAAAAAPPKTEASALLKK